MNKALEILKELLESAPYEVQYNKLWEERLINAISEIEEAMEHKECSAECKHLIFGMNSCGSTVNCEKDYMCKRVAHLLKDEFKPKEKK